MKDHIEKMLKQDVIEQSDGPWASPIVFVQIKDGSTRFCVDYRKLNEMMLGRKVRLPTDLMYGTLNEKSLESRNSTEFISNLRTYLDCAHELAREHIKNASEKQKWYYDYRTHIKTYKTGDADGYMTQKEKLG